MELETPVGTPEIESPATSHLRKVRLPIDAQSEEATELTEALADMNLPGTLRESLQMLKEVGAWEPEGKTGAKLKRAKMKRLAAHVHALSQGPMAPPINHKEFSSRRPHAGALARITGLYPKKPRGKTA
jgi:hypothetical protein